ncbi:hypothetical protein B0H17DRAFT_1327661 [Mycena rosella]|uniref:Uncharacterized protein n=1 Tax=Mycena rosella TaxID=1033263 RepID=A0AAD7DZ22_MYCRO|nr:hypothetical protein B0H17DRAFT_1327661 [Mycena rosella]
MPRSLPMLSHEVMLFLGLRTTHPRGIWLPRNLSATRNSGILCGPREPPFTSRDMHTLALRTTPGFPRRAGLRRNFTFAATNLLQKPPKPRWRIPSTFRPENLQSTDFFSALPHPFVNHYYHPQPESPEVSLTKRHLGSSIAWVPSKCPKSSGGFLYYHAPDGTPLAGCIRFRVTEDYDPASGASPAAAFAAGYDLPIQHESRLPWAFPVWAVHRYPEIRTLLRAEGWRVQEREASGTDTMTDCSLALHALGQPFLVEFHMYAVQVWILRPGMRAMCARIVTGFTDLSSKKYRMPYQGMGLMTVERLPEGTLVTHLHKVFDLQQVYTNDNVPRPVEGMMRRLQVAPILFKAATKPDNAKYKGGADAAFAHIRALPDYDGPPIGGPPTGRKSQTVEVKR